MDKQRTLNSKSKTKQKQKSEMEDQMCMQGDFVRGDMCDPPDTIADLSHLT